MKKIAIIFVSALFFAFLPFAAFADVVTTSPQESTEQTGLPAGRYEGYVYDIDVTALLVGCGIAISALAIYGIVKLKQAKKDGLDN